MDTAEATTKQTIYRELRRQIIMGHCAPGERFNVDEIAARFCTSVTPVRDALQMLSQEELVTIRPRSGYFVTQITLKQLRDLLDLRRVLEVAAVERAARRITEKELGALRHVHAGYTGDDDVSYDRYTDENRAFHYLLASASGNQELADMVHHLHDRLARFMVMRRAGKSQESTHEKIIAALQANDAATAREALLNDIDTAHGAILDKVLQEEADSWPVNGRFTRT